MKRIVLAFVFVVTASIKGVAQYDSLVIYYRPPCTDYGKVNNDVNQIKNFGKVKRKLILDRNRIMRVARKMRKLKLYKKYAVSDLANEYLLGGYVYREGKEELLFTISSFGRLNYNGKVLSYKDSFLDLLFGEKPPCYY